MFWLDSTQGYLEFAESEQRNKDQIRFRTDDVNNFETHLFKLKQLEHERFIEAHWRTETRDSGEYFAIEQMCLTIAGKELLEKLRAASKRGRLKVQLRTVFWSVVTSIATTLAVLALRD